MKTILTKAELIEAKNLFYQEFMIDAEKNGCHIGDADAGFDQLMDILNPVIEEAPETHWLNYPENKPTVGNLYVIETSKMNGEKFLFVARFCLVPHRSSPHGKHIFLSNGTRIELSHVVKFQELPK